MRNRHHIVSHSTRAVGRFVREPGPRSGLAGSSFAQHVVSLLLGLAPVVALALVGVVLFWGWRVWGRRRLAAGGCWFELRPGEEVSRSALEALMRTLAGGLRRPWFGAAPWVALSLSCEEDRAACGLFVSGGQSAVQVCAAVGQAFGVAVTQTPDATRVGVGAGGRLRVASLGMVGSRFLPLRVDHGVDPAGQLLAALRAAHAGEGGVVQLILQAPARSARRRARAEAARLRSGRGGQPGLSLDGLGAFVSGTVEVFLASGSPDRGGSRSARRPVEAFSVERARAIDAKAGGPLLAGSLRVGAWAGGWRRAGGRLGGLLAAFAQFHDLGGLRRRFEPFCRARLERCLPAMRPRLLLSCGEAAVLVALPERSAHAPLSFAEAPSRTVAPVAGAPSGGLLLGRSDHPGFAREVRVDPTALLAHTHVLGPTGRGKSTLLLNMTVEAMRAGMGGMLLDPTGELTALTLARIPRERVGDVELLDLGETSHPPALNLLACSPGEGDAHARAICGIFARLFTRFWGPRTEDILRSALTTLLCGRDPAGPEPTLADVLTLLSDPGERSRYRASDPVALDVFWRQWQTLSDTARVQALAPLSNKLRALLGSRTLRNMLCQPAAPDLTDTITHGRWLLVSLPQTLGEDAAELVGSVLLHRAWQAAQRLGPLAHSSRPPFLCLVDECHRFCHLPQGMAVALAQARGYGVGLVLAHQNLAQLKDHELAEAVDANCQTKLCFGLGAADAKRMAVHFQPRLEAYDLLHLDAHTIACRVLHEAHQLPTATAKTLPPPAPTPGDTAQVIRGRAREQATARPAVEAAILERYGRIEQPPPGRTQADEPQHDPGEDPAELENVEDAPLDAPYDAPYGAPSDGAPPPPAIPRWDSDPALDENPDNDLPFNVRGGRL